MRKIVISENIMTIIDKKSFLSREDVKLFTAATNDEILKIHRAEQVGLIIAPLNLPGMKSEELYASIRDDRELRSVSVIIICPNTPPDIERSNRCKANAVMTMPVNASLLLDRAQQLLDISWRESYRVLLSVGMEGKSKDMSFFCRSENLSSTGILIETDKVFAKGDQVVCSFFLPDSQQIQTKGEIVRVIKQAVALKTSKYGIKFSTLTPEAKSAIEAFVDRRSQMSTSRK